METFWDWITVIAFGGLVVLMLNRSSQENPPDKLVQYLVAAAGCGIANYVGNEYSDVGAAVALGLVAVFVYKVLKWPPAGFFSRQPDDNRPDNRKP
jgi:hypothetical protein